jgi:hypothetical protein
MGDGGTGCDASPTPSPIAVQAVPSALEADLELLDLIKAIPRVRRWFESSVHACCVARVPTRVHTSHAAFERAVPLACTALRDCVRMCPEAAL